MDGGDVLGWGGRGWDGWWERCGKGVGGKQAFYFPNVVYGVGKGKEAEE